VTFFTTVTVTNVFNTIRRTSTARSNDGNVQSPYPGMGYRINSTAANVNLYGAASNYLFYQGGRDLSLDFGLRF
jgi:hypothetical protein